VALAPLVSTRKKAPAGLFTAIAWRNLWRNKRRTWLTAGGIAFAILLVVFSMAAQSGSYEGMIDSAARLATGYIQIQHPDYQDNPRLRSTLTEATPLMRRVAGVQGVTAVAPRAEGFALISAGERSYGAMVMGVDREAELGFSSLPSKLTHGNYLESSIDAFIGSALARNLGVSVGDELVVLGTAKQGGVAAMVFIVGGIFDTGQPILDRTILQVRLATLQDGFELGDEVHRLVVMTDDVGTSGEVVTRLRGVLDDKVRVLGWTELLPGMEQAIQLDRISANFMYWILMILVTLSIVNTFIMTVFERTREFGMLLSLGMRPGTIVMMLEMEAFSIWVVGAIVGLTLSVAIIVPLGIVGIPLSGMEELARQYGMPDRLRPVLDLRAALTAPLVMGVGALLAALIPAMRVRKLRPIEALRETE
ncbi:MAG: FtsX-like permease family protein, partial [Gammaproteobacteria bacterium]|nr:FtsX-like permease family protein [Gammaproteobacteria bacterium]